MPAEPLATMHTAANSDNLTLPSGVLWGPGASVTPEEALLSHTVGGAVACNLESDVGMLRYALSALVVSDTFVHYKKYCWDLSCVTPSRAVWDP